MYLRRNQTHRRSCQPRGAVAQSRPILHLKVLVGRQPSRHIAGSSQYQSCIRSLLLPAVSSWSFGSFKCREVRLQMSWGSSSSKSGSLNFPASQCQKCVVSWGLVVLRSATQWSSKIRRLLLPASDWSTTQSRIRWSGCSQRESCQWRHASAKLGQCRFHLNYWTRR